MDKLKIIGPTKLSGTVEVSGAKNACLPIMAAVLLTDKKVTLNGLPKLRDVSTMNKLLSNLGVKINESESKTTYQMNELVESEANYELVRTMRASILVLGPLLARYGHAKVSLPGGCAIGTRPIDIHLSGLKKMGATIELNSGYVQASANGLNGAEIVLPFPSVGATENLMMAATLAKGKTIIENAACEPEIVDLARFLNLLGGKIKGAGTQKIEIEGVQSLTGAEYQVIGDRIEAGTFIIAALATNSNIKVTNIRPEFIESILDKLEEMGARFELEENAVTVLPHQGLQGIQVDTAPYPGLPTDIQAQFMALCSVANSSSVITEHIFENRFMHVPELQRMGANIIFKGSTAMTEGKGQLSGAPVMCTDLRASAALIIAGLVAEGETLIQRIYHLDRGYEGIDKKLKILGANIERII